MSWNPGILKIIKRLLFLLVLAALAAPAVIQEVRPFSPRSLYGYFQTVERPVFHPDSFRACTFQPALENYVNNNFGYRNYYVRTYNQIDYSLFRIPHAERIVAGKKGCLFAVNYLSSYTGKGFKGKQYIESKVRQMKILQDALWKQHGIYLMPVFSADKGTFYPELVPSRYLRRPRTINNYEYYVEQCREQGVTFFDANRYLLELKDTCRYSLYPYTGIHWSEYGAVLVADTLFRWLQDLTGTPVARIIPHDIRVSQSLTFGDDDIIRTMNLLCDVSHPPGAYPVLSYSRDTTAPKPRALFIGDSFFWQWYNIGIIHNLFSNVQFWYYDKEVFPECFAIPKYTSQLDLRSEILSQKFIIIVQTNGGAGDFGAGFLDRLYGEFDSSASNPIRGYENIILKSPKWVREELRKAKEQNLTFRQMVRNDAIYLYNKELSGQ